MITIYLDNCCLNRPFDDQTQPRIHLEAEAVLHILLYHETGYWQWVSSEVVEDELEQNPNEEKRALIRQLSCRTGKIIKVKANTLVRASEIKKWGIDDYDALHLACAESGKVSVFLTTDDKLLKKALKWKNDLKVRVANPLVWMQEIEQ
jgi:predicted nucleic acid-binding protein